MSEAFWRALRRRHPGVREAILADAAAALRFRGEGGSPTPVQIVRLACVSDAFLALILYRVKAALQRHGVPALPRVAHRLAIVLGQIAIGDPVVVEPGVYIPHGQVVIDGIVEIGAGTVIAPFVTVGLREGSVRGPAIGTGVDIGTGARVLGAIRVGDRARIGAGAVVLDDVDPGATVVGIPAR